MRSDPSAPGAQPQTAEQPSALGEPPSNGEGARSAPLPITRDRLHAIARDSGLPMSWLDTGAASAWRELEAFAQHVAQATLEGLPLSQEEIRYILSTPGIVSALMTYHSTEQDMADAIGLECRGNATRYEELKALGRQVIEQDPLLWPEALRREFGVETPTSAVPGIDRTESRHG